MAIIWSELTGSQRWIWTTFRTPQVLFWIDTLCIPVGQEYNRIKMQSINSMAKTYASAQAVVILDHELQQIKHLGKPVSELLGLLACSAWTSRCWTFQEGALARKWLIQFDDGNLETRYGFKKLGFWSSTIGASQIPGGCTLTKSHRT